MEYTMTKTKARPKRKRMLKTARQDITRANAELVGLKTWRMSKHNGSQDILVYLVCNRINPDKPEYVYNKLMERALEIRTHLISKIYNAVTYRERYINAYKHICRTHLSRRSKVSMYQLLTHISLLEKAVNSGCDVPTCDHCGGAVFPGDVDPP